jgi:RHS repeat-associated protein
LPISNFEYAHKPYDSTTGFYYYGARYYDPSISRFISEDSLQYSNTQNSLSLNRYAYVINNPETMIDPSGHVFIGGGGGGSDGQQQNSKLTYNQYLDQVWLTNPGNLEQIGLGILTVLTVLMGPAIFFLVSAVAGGSMDLAAAALAGMLVGEQLLPDLADLIEGASTHNVLQMSEGFFNLASDAYSFLTDQLNWVQKLEFFSGFGSYEGVTAFFTAGSWQAGSLELAADTATGLLFTWSGESFVEYNLFAFSQ